MAYWSLEDNNPPTYHTHTSCPDGKRIKPKKMWVGLPQSYRTMCAICRRLEGLEASAEAAQSSIKAS